jgi:hypothetical protein
MRNTLKAISRAVNLCDAAETDLEIHGDEQKLAIQNLLTVASDNLTPAIFDLGDLIFAMKESENDYDLQMMNLIQYHEMGVEVLGNIKHFVER